MHSKQSGQPGLTGKESVLRKKEKQAGKLERYSYMARMEVVLTMRFSVYSTSN